VPMAPSHKIGDCLSRSRRSEAIRLRITKNERFALRAVQAGDGREFENGLCYNPLSCI